MQYSNDLSLAGHRCGLNKVSPLKASVRGVAFDVEMWGDARPLRDEPQVLSGATLSRSDFCGILPLFS